MCRRVPGEQAGHRLVRLIGVGSEDVRQGPQRGSLAGAQGAPPSSSGRRNWTGPGAATVRRKSGRTSRSPRADDEQRAAGGAGAECRARFPLPGRKRTRPPGAEGDHPWVGAVRPGCGPGRALQFPAESVRPPSGGGVRGLQAGEHGQARGQFHRRPAAVGSPARSPPRRNSGRAPQGTGRSPQTGSRGKHQQHACSGGRRLRTPPGAAPPGGTWPRNGSARLGQR